MFLKKNRNNLITDRYLKGNQYKQIYIDEIGQTYFLRVNMRNGNRIPADKLIDKAIKVELFHFLKEIFFPVTLILSLYFLSKHYFIFSSQHHRLFLLLIFLTLAYIFFSMRNLPIRVYLRYTHCLVDNSQALRSYYALEGSVSKSALVSQLTEKFRAQRARYQELIRELGEQEKTGDLSEQKFYSLLRELSYIANYKELRQGRTRHLGANLSKLTYRMDLETDRLIPNDYSYSKKFLIYVAQVCSLDIDKFGYESAVYFLYHIQSAKMDGVVGIGFKACEKLACACLQYVDDFDSTQKALLRDFLVEVREAYLYKEQKKFLDYFLKNKLKNKLKYRLKKPCKGDSDE
ncbi:TPA: hypothetical protein ACGO9X_001908 [Streptococcus suis]